MKRTIEKRLNTLEKKLVLNPSTIGEIIIYETEKGTPEELFQDKNIVRIFIPDNHRDLDLLTTTKKEREQEMMLARIKV